MTLPAGDVENMNMARETARLFDRMRERRPLVHHITNYVTVNDCANIAICAGAAPVMADATEEMDDMVAIAGALVLNIGTLNERLVSSMLQAGKRANEMDIPVVLDPVGVGATPYRTETAKMLLDKLEVSVLKGNAGEVATLAGSEAKVVGVDSREVSGDLLTICEEYAVLSGCNVAMTGPQDFVSDGTRSYMVENGDDMMEMVSGTGCMASTLVGAMVSGKEDALAETAAALAAFGLAGEHGARSAQGPMSFKTALFDGLQALKVTELAAGARVTRL